MFYPSVFFVGLNRLVSSWGFWGVVRVLVVLCMVAYYAWWFHCWGGCARVVFECAIIIST